MADGVQIPELDHKGLREFGLLTGGIVVGLFGFLLPWLVGFAFPVWPWVLGGLLAAWALAAPGSLRPVYRAWMRFGLALSRITTPLLLGLVFFLLIAPVALGMRLFGRDPMARDFDKTVKTYRVASKKSPREKMEKPF